MPYNVRELFPAAHRHIRIGVFSVLLLWLGMGPAGVGDYLVRRPRQLLLMPFWAAVIGLVSWAMLWFSVTRESLGDILGWPTLGWGGNWELLVRFLALQGIGTLSLLLACVTIGSILEFGWPRGLKRSAMAFACGGPWLVLCWFVVVRWANTDNLTELIRTTPSACVGPVFLTALVLLLALNVAALGYAWARGSLPSKLAATVVSPLLVGPGWILLWLGLEPAVEKYEMTFPAARFLLGPDRQTEMSWQHLLLRWGAVQLGGVLVLAIGTGIAISLLRGRFRTPGVDDCDRTEEPSSQHGLWKAGRAYSVLAAFYAGLLLYGSLIPLDFHFMPLRDAWRVFRDGMRPLHELSGQADMVTNIAMLVPFAFFALGALSREDRRRGRWWMVPVVFAAGVALSFVLEFSQVFVPQRSPSVHDTIAQTVGNMLGLAAWLAFGAPLSRWVRGLVSKSNAATLHMRLLYTYAALFIFYSVLPLNPTVSARQVWSKYKAGMIQVIPFANPSDLDLLVIVMKTLLYIPIGYLVACRGGRTRRPWMLALIGGGLFASGVEVLQVFVRGRIATTTDIVLGTFGAAIGGLLAQFAGPIATGNGFRGAWWHRWGTAVKLPLAAGWFVLIACHRWVAIPAHLAGVTMKDKLGATLQTPPGSMVYSVGPLAATARIAQEFGAFLILGMLIQSILAGYRRHAVIATLATLLLVLAIELGSLAFTSYRNDVTLTIFALAGAIVSAWAYPRCVALFFTPAREATTQ
ncbi:MAG: VanZ family protein [Thermoguttaceae bacterium]|jgi:glycopeptide antibiotics resistance protein|nr:VanZ family protein [Thermoguttaceae bacterium]